MRVNLIIIHVCITFVRDCDWDREYKVLGNLRDVPLPARDSGFFLCVRVFSRVACESGLEEG